MLGLAQSSVTAQLHALEARIGEPLFDRHARGIRPTPGADDLANRLAGPLDALATALGSPPPADAPPVRLGGAGDLLAVLAAPALASAVAGGLRVAMTPGLAADLLDRIATGSLDLVVSAVRPRGRAFPTVALFDEEFVLVASPSLGIEPSVDLRPDALASTPLLAFAQDVPILRRYWRHVFGIRLERAPALIAPDLRALVAAAVAGAGVTVLPTYLIAGELADGRLTVLRATDDPPINTLYLVRRPGSLSEGVAVVERALRDVVADL